MTKHLPPPMRMRVERGRLVPAGQYDAERLDSYRVGSTVMVRFTSDRMRPLERKYRAILGKVVKECDTPWSNAEAAHQAIKLACGYVNYGKTKSGEFFQWPRSIADFGDDEMEDYFNLALGVMSEVSGVDVETLKRETAHVDEEDDEIIDPETGEVLPDTNTGDAPSSPATEAEDRSAGPASPEPAATSADSAAGSSDSAAVPPADMEPAGHHDAPTTAAAGSSSLLPEDQPLSIVERALLIECCAKFMDLTIRPDLDPAGRRQALAVAKDAWKSEIKPHLHPKVASMFLAADNIIRGKAVREHAIVEFADWLGCTPTEIGD